MTTDAGTPQSGAQESEDEALARRARARSVTIKQQASDLYRNIADLAAGEAEDVATVKLQLDASRKNEQASALLANFHHQHSERVRVDLLVAKDQIAALKSKLTAAETERDLLRARVAGLEEGLRSTLQARRGDISLTVSHLGQVCGLLDEGKIDKADEYARAAAQAFTQDIAEIDALLAPSSEETK